MARKAWTHINQVHSQLSPVFINTFHIFLRRCTSFFFRNQTKSIPFQFPLDQQHQQFWASAEGGTSPYAGNGFLAGRMKLARVERHLFSNSGFGGRSDGGLQLVLRFVTLIVFFLVSWVRFLLIMSW